MYSDGTNRASYESMTNDGKSYSEFAARILADYAAEEALVASIEAIKVRTAAKKAEIEKSTVRA